MNALFLFLLLPLCSTSQLPKPELIRNAGIIKIDVWNHQMPDTYKVGFQPTTFEPIEKPKDARQDTVTTLLRSWFLNQNGFPYKGTSENNGNQFESHYIYDDLNRMIELKDMRNGVDTYRELVLHKNDSTLEYKNWRDGKLRAHYLTTLDSVMTYAFPVEKGHIPYYIYKPDSHYTESSVYLRGKISNTRKERWILDSSGKPKSLEIEFIQYERVTKRNGNQKSYHKVIPVNSDGTTERIPEISFPSKSFYSQKRKFEFISPYVLQDFRGDKIVERTEDITIETFDIKDPNYFQSYIFYYNKKEH